jgi:hypothetical protein
VAQLATLGHIRAMSNTKLVLFLIVYAVAWTGINYLIARLFIRTASMIGRKLGDSITLKSVCIWFAWATMIVLRSVPCFIALGYRRPVDAMWALLVILCFAISVLPASRYVSKNLAVLYGARYGKKYDHVA